MAASYHAHALFESAVYRAFSTHPIPKMEWEKRTTFGYQAKELLTGRTWPEVIGCRLNDGELDPSLSIWMRTLLLDVFHYYLPSHLIFASISLALGSVAYYPLHVMEAFILPLSTDKTELEKMDEDTSFESSLAENAEVRIALYKRMSKEQRVCVATYLSMYLTYNDVEPEVESIYMRSRDIWENSSLQI